LPLTNSPSAIFGSPAVATLSGTLSNAARPLRVRVRSARSLYAGYEKEWKREPSPLVSYAYTRRSACRSGIGRKSVALASVKIVVGAPMPIASEMIASAVKPGLERS
jgi:hypothetical protein